MLDCRTLDPLVTPYVDGELDAASRAEVDAHLGRCAPCHSRVAAERSVRELLHARQPALTSVCAPPSLCARCAASRRYAPRAVSSWRARATPFAFAATLVLIVGGAFVYQLTDRSAHVMAAELTADHIKCFGVNRLLGTHDTAAVVESSIGSSFGLHLSLPDRPARAGLELVGERPCLYGEGRVAHIMYRHNGHPVSLFMLPKTTRPDGIVEVMGHEAAIWSAGDRTFVLIAREPRSDVEQLAAFVHAALR
jgi:anti-sigma factor RsiW